MHTIEVTSIDEPRNREKWITTNKKKRCWCSALRISHISGQFIPRIFIAPSFFADRSNLNTPVNDVLIKIDFTKISLGTNDLALHQDVSLNLEGRLPPLLLNKFNVSLQSGDLIRGFSIGFFKLWDSASYFFQLIVFFLKTLILRQGYLLQFFKLRSKFLFRLFQGQFFNFKETMLSSRFFTSLEAWMSADTTGSEYLRMVAVFKSMRPSHWHLSTRPSWSSLIWSRTTGVTRVLSMNSG